MPKCMLIVDDSPVMRSFIRRAVEIAGLEVSEYVEAGDGLEALGLLEHDPVDVILTDLNMPGIDGEKLLRWLKKHPRWKSIPVMVISTDATRYRRQELMKLGASGYLTKPFSPERLRELLDPVFSAERKPA